MRFHYPARSRGFYSFFEGQWALSVFDWQTKSADNDRLKGPCARINKSSHGWEWVLCGS